ncbi:MAG TPA: amino acid adenylation domain-containing protein, partial [Thermoanaerobaculia bacterium]|nr:amino acid adenylation domain-containing protein [Thermoanaerobaculia bacterium]
MDRSAEMVAALLGILAAGAVYVPLDPTFPRERLALMLEDARPTLLLTQERLAGALPQGAALFFLEQTQIPAEAVQPSPGDLAYVLYTSGSTGRPKGVAIPHRAVVNFLDAVRLSPGLAAKDALLALTTLSFDIAVLEIFLPLTVGATVVVATRDDARGGAELRAALANPSVTVMQATPAAWRLLLESGWEGSPSLKALCGGEALPRELADSLVERCGELWNMYGPTETTVWSMTQRVVSGSGPVPVGHPLGNTDIHLLDGDSSLAPIGVPGELWIGGAGLARGYLGRPDLTAAAFLPHSFSNRPGERLYRTGDLARRLPDGTMELLGRIDHQVKVRGFRIELGDIEAHLARHPAVQAAVAMVHEGRLVAYLVPASQPVPGMDEIRRFLAASLPEYMLPAAWVWLEALPLTPNGKVDRKALPRPEVGRPELTAVFVAPRTELERSLAGAWREVLGTEEVGIHDNFFDLGGHSLLGTRLMARIESRLGVALPLRALFETPTVETLAVRIEQALGGETGRLAPSLAAGPRPAELPLSFAQERLWFLDQIDGPGATYNIPCAVDLAGVLDTAALGRALGEVVCRHEVLRTRFEVSSGQPRQVIEPPPPVPLPVVDIAGLSGDEALRLATAEAARPFDLTCPQLLRACLFRRGAEDHLLVLTLHHIAADGWSLGVLVHELAAFYQGETLEELPLQYADFALWQRQWLSGETLAQEVAWWREQLAGAPEEIPFDRPRATVPFQQGRRCPADLPMPRELDTLCREQQATLFMVLLSAFAALLSRWSGEEDLVVGSPVANRSRVETEGLIGFFVNMLPLRIDLAGQPTFTALLARVRETALEAYAHQDLPFEKLVEALQPARHLGRTPLFQAAFALQNAPFTAAEVAGLSWSPRPLETETAKFDLTLVLEERGKELSGYLEYSRDRFDAAAGRRLLEHWRNLLDGGVADPRTRISDLTLLSGAELRQVTVEWNETRTSYPLEST